MLNVLEYAWWIAGGLAVVATPVWVCRVLLRRMRRGLPRARAAFLLAPTLLLPIAYLGVMVALYGLAHLPEGSTSIWTGDAGIVGIGTVAALLAWVGLVNAAFWLFSR